MSTKSKKSVVKVDAALTISEVSALKEDILNHLQLCDTMTINVEGIEALDIAGLQLLCAANRSFEHQKKRFLVETGENAGLFETFMIQAGYDQRGRCHENSCARCLWKGD